MSHVLIYFSHFFLVLFSQIFKSGIIFFLSLFLSIFILLSELPNFRLVFILPLPKKLSKLSYSFFQAVHIIDHINILVIELLILPFELFRTNCSFFRWCKSFMVQLRQSFFIIFWQCLIFCILQAQIGYSSIKSLYCWAFYL